MERKINTEFLRENLQERNNFGPWRRWKKNI
jgi:hypothetical protein